MEISAEWAIRKHNEIVDDPSIERIEYVSGKDVLRVWLSGAVFVDIHAEVTRRGTPIVVVTVDNPQQQSGTQARA